MTLDVYLRGKRVRLDPRKAIGKGGEADVFDLGRGVALKVFKSPDHPDYQGLPHEQKAAEERIAVHQHKLADFPSALPPQVVTPLDLATDRSGRFTVGYSMPLIRPAEPLLRYAEPRFRRAGVSNAAVIEIFQSLHQATSGLHRAGVVIGDFNDLNVLVSPPAGAHLIDADSYQFGPYPCAVFTERFVDPLLCDGTASSPRLVRPYNPGADWYAYSALLMQSLLFVGPYGGIYRPRRASEAVVHAARPLHRITVFHPEVRYPKPATSYQVLPDDLLQHFHQVFEKDERGPFPEDLLRDLHFSTCPSCSVEHARAACPLCSPHASARTEQVVRVRGEVLCKHVFETKGVILRACVESGRLGFVYHDAGAYRREDGSPILHGDLDPGLCFRILGTSTLVGRTNEVVVLSADAEVVERFSVDTDGTGPAFDTNGRHRYWTHAGHLFRDAPPTAGVASAVAMGDVLEGQTRVWAGPTFGIGLYRASNLSVAFRFDPERRGIDDTLRLPPLRGQLVNAVCYLDEQRAWLLLALHAGGRTRHLCLAYSRDGALEGTLEGEADDASWLGTLGGKVAVRGMLLSSTDAGLVRVEVEAGALHETRDFPDTEPFVDAGCRLLVGSDGLYVVGPREISTLSMN